MDQQTIFLSFLGLAGLGGGGLMWIDEPQALFAAVAVAGLAVLAAGLIGFFSVLYR